MKRTRKKNFPKWVLVLFLVFLLTSIVVLLIRQKSVWGKSGLIMALEGNNGTAAVLIFDTENRSLTTIKLPPDTEIEASRQLGYFRLKNIWKLGVDEYTHNKNLPKPGEFFADSLMKTLGVPIYAWGSQDLEGLERGDYFKLFKPFTEHSNLSFSDKVNLFLLSLKVKDLARVEIDLAKERIVTKTRLEDGEQGYRVVNIPLKIRALFSDIEISSHDSTVEVVNSTGQVKDARFIAKLALVLESTGAKVVAISNSEEKDFNCILSGKNNYLIQRVGLLFSCSVKAVKNSNTDLLIELGRQFYRNF